MTTNKNDYQKILPEKEITNKEIIKTDDKKNIYVDDGTKKFTPDKNLETNSYESLTNEYNNNSTKIQSMTTSNFSSSHQSKVNIFGINNPKEEWNLKLQRVLVLSYKGIPKPKIKEEKNNSFNNDYNENSININTIINRDEKREIVFKTKDIRPQKKNWNIFNIGQRGIELDFSEKNNNWNLDISHPNNFSFKKEFENENNNEVIILNNDYNSLKEDHLEMRCIHATILKVHDDDSRSSVSSYDFLQYVKTKNMIGINDSQNIYETEINKIEKNYNEDQMLKIFENNVNNGNIISDVKEKRELKIPDFEEKKKPNIIFNNLIERTKVKTIQTPIDEKNMSVNSNTNIKNDYCKTKITEIKSEINTGNNNFANENISKNENHQQMGKIEINEIHNNEINKDSKILNANENKKTIKLNEEINKNNVGNVKIIEDGKNIDLNYKPNIVVNDELLIKTNIKKEVKSKDNESNNSSKIKITNEINVRDNSVKNEPEKQNIIKVSRQNKIQNTQKKIENNEKLTEIEQQKKIEKKQITTEEKIEFSTLNEKKSNVLLFNKRNRSPLPLTSKGFKARSRIGIKNEINRNPSADSKEIRKILVKSKKMKKFEYLREEPCESNILK